MPENMEPARKEREVSQYLATVIIALDEAHQRIKQLEEQLLYANDAVSKGDLARQNAGGMEMQIQQLLDDLQLVKVALEGNLQWLKETHIQLGDEGAAMEHKSLSAALTLINKHTK